MMRRLRLIAVGLIMLVTVPAWADGVEEVIPVGELIPVEYVRTIDGDTIVVNRDGEEIRVRLIGIDAPEMDTGTRDAYNAANNMSVCCEGASALFLELDEGAGERDRYGRTLAWVWAHFDTFMILLNDRVGKYGVTLYTDYPYSKYADVLRNAEDAGTDDQVVLLEAARLAGIPDSTGDVPLAVETAGLWVSGVFAPENIDRAARTVNEAISNARDAVDDAPESTGDPMLDGVLAEFDPHNPNTWVMANFESGNWRADNFGCEFYVDVTNISDQLLSMVSVTVIVYDSTGRTVGSGIHNLVNLASGQHKVAIVHVGDVDEWQVDKIGWQVSAYKW